jgi:Possible lysine decarboxylase
MRCELGSVLSARGVSLVYGGARVGLMGAIADAALTGGGEVIGVLPAALRDREIGHEGLSELHVVGSMHERNALMAELSDAFIAIGMEGAARRSAPWLARPKARVASHPRGPVDPWRRRCPRSSGFDSALDGSGGELCHDAPLEEHLAVPEQLGVGVGCEPPHERVAAAGRRRSTGH